MKKIAIMGAHGFVGKNLTEFLQDRYETYQVTRDNFSLLEPFKVRKFLEDNKTDVVINCASIGGSRKNDYQEKDEILTDNLRIFFNIESCLQPHMKLINFGSGAQYNKKRDLVKVSEDEMGKDIPQDQYGYSKYIISKYVNKCSNIYNPIIFALFGKYEDYTFRFISNAIIKNILQMPIVIHQNTVFDYLYMDDFLNIIELLIENNYESREFNMTPVESIDLITAAEYINSCGSYQSEIIVKNKGMNFEYTGNNQKMLKNIGNYPFISYAESIQRLYQYYLENINRIDIAAIKNDRYEKYCKIRTAM